MKASTFLHRVRNAKHGDGGPLYSSVLLKPKKREPSYACPICDEHYPTVEAMLDCLNTPPKPGRFKVGDIVLVGDWKCRPDWRGSPWVAFTIPPRPKSPDHFKHVEQFFLWHVITSLWNKKHDEVASLVSLPSEDEISYGWNPTTSGGHHGMFTEAEVTAGAFLAGHSNDYYEKEFKGITIAPPSRALRAEAKILADAGLVITNLI